MGEYTDLFTRVQLVKNKILEMDPKTELKPINIDVYDYLIYQVLYSEFTREKLRDRVHEIYKDLLIETDCPDLYEIVDTIDEENIAIIITFYQSMNLSQEDVIESVVAHYTHDISCMLDDWIEDILKGDGYSYKGLTLMKMFVKNHEAINMAAQHDGQNVVNPEWL